MAREKHEQVYVIWDQSLIIPGRGQEDIFIGTKKISWPLNFPSEILMTNSTVVIFHGPTLHVQYFKRKTVFLRELLTVHQYGM